MTADTQQQAWDAQDREDRVARVTAKQLEVDGLAERIVTLKRELSQARRKHQEARWELATLVRLLTATGPCRPAARPHVPREETPAGRSTDPDADVDAGRMTHSAPPAPETPTQVRDRYDRDDGWGMVPPDEAPASDPPAEDPPPKDLGPITCPSCGKAGCKAGHYCDRCGRLVPYPPEDGPAPAPFQDDSPPYSVFPLPDGKGWTVRNRHGIPWHSSDSEQEARAECDRLNALCDAQDAARHAPLPTGPETPAELDPAPDARPKRRRKKGGAP